MINFYNIQFYNQGDSKYDSYEELFIASTGYFNGTSVKEIISKKVSSKKIVVGKPVTQGDASNTGFVPASDLGSWTTKGYTDLKWYGGVMYWQYVSDNGGNAIQSAAGHLKELCAINRDCK